MLNFAVEGVKEIVDEKNISMPVLLGVTILTSMSEDDLQEIGLAGPVEKRVEEFVKLAKNSGMHGVVASAQEIKRIKELAGEKFIVVTPGIRPAWTGAGDQKRVKTPKQAIKDGVDYIVVGRPIIQAENPLEAAKRIIAEMG